MEEQSDKTFIRNFSVIVIVLILFTVAIVFLAKSVGFKEDQDVPSRAGLTQARIKPVADVYTQASVAAVKQEAVAQESVEQETVEQEAPEQKVVEQEAPEQKVIEQEVVEQEAVAEAAPAQAVASADDLDAEKIYTSVCAACHSTGILDAPKPGTAEMAQRAEKGMDILMKNALDGLNAMPARGGGADLSDEEVKAAVEFMLK